MSAGGGALLVLERVGLRWPHGVLFDGLDWRVGAGAALVQGGPGSGKTALLRLLAGELAPAAGRVLLGGVALSDAGRQVYWPAAALAGADQTPVRAWWQTQAAHWPHWDPAALARHAEGFGLAPHQDKAFFMLSTGTRRKAQLAAALASGAPLTLIDEPLAGLDLASVRYLSQALADAATHPARVIVVAHDAPLDGVPWAGTLVLPDAA